MSTQRTQASERSQAEQCLMPGCESEAFVRGLCRSCYQTSLRKVHSHEISWQKLIDAGFALAANQPRCPASLAIAKLAAS